jgi:hypothetical protein
VAAVESRTPDLPDWLSVLRAHGDRLETVDSDQSAKDTFVTTLGPALHLPDVAGTIGAKGLPAKLTKELLLPDITRSAQRLVAALAAWQAAEAITQSLAEPMLQKPLQSVPSSTRLEWLNANGPFPSLMPILQPTTAVAQTPSSETEPVSDRIALAVAAGRASIEASQQVVSEWWQLKSWKDRVRTLRGQARLCGTWQWVIHNHQRHHQEQKLSLLFPPPGKEGAGIPGLAETIVLGDIVYLRWEIDGRTQEDSLLFTKEAQRLEGTFVNSQGGWGSISGKRTASCTP